MICRAKCNTTLTALRQAPVVKPAKAGLYWRGVNHGVLLDAVIAGMKAAGTPPDARHARLWLSEDGADVRAAFPVNFPGAGPWTPYLGVSASNARRGVLTFYAGAVGPGDVPLVVSKISRNTDYRWLYTFQFDPKFVIDQVRSWAGLVFKSLPMVEASLANWTPAEAEAFAVLFRLGRRHVVPFSRVGRPEAAWRKGSDKSGLGLLAAVTAQLPRAAADRQMADALSVYNEFRYELELHLAAKTRKAVTA